MDREAFLSLVKSDSAVKLARSFVLAESVAAFPDSASYAAFKRRVALTFNDTEGVHLVGSANWGYSLHPEKAFKPFGKSSDIDIAVISAGHFNSLWNEMRRCHRKRWYWMSDEERAGLRRNAENIYAGFISPLWLPDIKSSKRLEFKRYFNQLSDHEVGYRVVKAYFFKNLIEALEYYQRGFAKARKAIQ